MILSPPKVRSFTDKKDLLIDLEQLQEANRWMIIEPQACRHCYNNIINDNNSTMNLMNKQTPCVMISSVPINHESVRKDLFENCGWCKLHRSRVWPGAGVRSSSLVSPTHPCLKVTSWARARLGAGSMNACIASRGSWRSLMSSWAVVWIAIDDAG